MKQVAKDHYNFSKYCQLDRWNSYYYQIKEVLQSKPYEILEVGSGDKTVKSFVEKTIDCKFVTADIAEDLSPDIVAPITNIPVSDNSFDTVMAFEVLEHIPFCEVASAVDELLRITRKVLLISVPHFGPSLRFNIKIPFLKEVRLSYKFIWPIRHHFLGEHYWELGKRGYPARLFKKMIQSKAYLIRDYIPFENQYHHFYVIYKKNN